MKSGFRWACLTWFVGGIAEAHIDHRNLSWAVIYSSQMIKMAVLTLLVFEIGWRGIRKIKFLVRVRKAKAAFQILSGIHQSTPSRNRQS